VGGTVEEWRRTVKPTGRNRHPVLIPGHRIANKDAFSQNSQGGNAHMFDRRNTRGAVVALLLLLILVPTRGSAFVESTVTQGEVGTDLNGIWLVVSHLEFAKPSPQPSPGAKAEKPAAEEPPRYFNVVNLLRIVHLPKAQAEVLRERDRKMEEASVEKAKTMIAEEQKKLIPVQTESGEVENEVKVLVPAVAAIRRPGDGDDVDMFLLDVALPEKMDEELQKAQKAEKTWTPTRDNLAELGKSWASLKPSGRDEVSKIEWKVVAKDKYDEQLQIDPTLKGSKFSITANQEMIPKPNTPRQNILVYGVRPGAPGVLEGLHVRAMMASAPFPLSIEMKGTFKMYHIADLPKDGDGAAPTKAESGAEKAAVAEDAKEEKAAEKPKDAEKKAAEKPKAE
jgi:hypothetical protein